MRPLLVLRPEPAATLAAAERMGLEAVAAPLFEAHPLPSLKEHPVNRASHGSGHPGRMTDLVLGWGWVETRDERGGEGLVVGPEGKGGLRSPSTHPQPLPCREGSALLLTSANAVRFHPGLLAALHHLPVYAVGPATAAAARAAGFAYVIAGDADAAAIVARAAADGVTRLLHLAGREHRAVTHPGVTIERVIVYAADAVDRLPEAARTALARGAVTLLHSPRAAALFARLMDEADLPRGPIAALSPAVAEAAGPGWPAVAVASRPTDAALLAAVARLCEETGDADAVRR